MHHDLTCPYCSTPQEARDIERDQDEDFKHEMECRSCEKSFVFVIHVHVTYEALAAECLNGAEHNYKETKTWPRRCARMQCTDCGDEKPLSPERMSEAVAEDASHAASSTGGEA